jgi:hypothetical protein
MKMQRLPDGTFATTPVFIGPTCWRVGVKAGMPPMCEIHNWVESNRAPLPEKFEPMPHATVMALEICKQCQCSRVRLLEK